MSIRHGLSMSEYLAIDALSSNTAFIALTRSPHHASYYRFNKDWSKVADVGTVAHQLLLEGNDDGLVVVDAPDWRTNAAKEQRDEAYKNGRTPILKTAFDDCKRLVDAVRKQIELTEIAGVFGSGQPEVTIEWEDHGIQCKARPDYLSDKFHISVKTTKASCEPGGWCKRQLGPSGYDFQLAFYDRGLRANGIDVEHRILVIEQDAPFCAAVVASTAARRAISDAMVEQAIKLWRDCLETASFPGYSPETFWSEPTAYELAEAEAKEYVAYA